MEVKGAYEYEVKPAGGEKIVRKNINKFSSLLQTVMLFYNYEEFENTLEDVKSLISELCPDNEL